MERSDRHLASLSDDGRYRLLVEAVTDYAIYMLDPTGIVTSWNPGAQRFKGYTAGEIVGYAKITRDLTERKEAQQKLERTREALLQAQKMEAIGQLTGGIAHDFNNLLMVVLGSLELMRKRLPDDPKLLGLLENAVRGAQRGATLTKRMLAFARRQEMRQEAVDIPELVRGMTELLQR